MKKKLIKNKEENLFVEIINEVVGPYIKELLITFFDFINSIDFLKIIVQYGILAIIIQYLSNKIKYNQDQKLKETEKNNTKEIQREAYYRSQNGDELKKLLEEYTLVITNPLLFGKDKSKKNPTEADNKKHVVNIMNVLVMYGSKEAISIAGILMQLVYKGNSEDVEIEEKDKWTQFWLAAKLVSQLKSDYTGVNIDPMDIIKLKITDLYKPDNINKFEVGKKEAEKLIENEIQKG